MTPSTSPGFSTSSLTKAQTLSRPSLPTRYPCSKTTFCLALGNKSWLSLDAPLSHGVYKIIAKQTLEKASIFSIMVLPLLGCSCRIIGLYPISVINRATSFFNPLSWPWTIKTFLFPISIFTSLSWLLFVAKCGIKGNWFIMLSRLIIFSFICCLASLIISSPNNFEQSPIRLYDIK